MQGAQPASFFAQTGIVFLTICALLAVSALIGAANVYVSAALKMPPALSGFLTSGILQGLTVLLLTGIGDDAKTVSGGAAQFVKFGTGRVGFDPVYSLPIVALIAATVVACMEIMFRQNSWQKRIDSVSASFISFYNPARDSNSTQRETLPAKILFKTMFPAAALAGACYALGGIMFAAKSPAITLAEYAMGGHAAGGRFSVDFMNGAFVSVLAGALTGKASVFGGRGAVWQAAACMTLISAVFYALDFALVPTGVQVCLKYGIIAAALVTDALKEKHRRTTPITKQTTAS
jgi:ribose/xylose/arabinose/galactoside ABC-type transport system permease subunit